MMAKKSQIEKFRETARAVEASEDEEVFNDALRKVAKVKPRDDSAPNSHKEKKPDN